MLRPYALAAAWHGARYAPGMLSSCGACEGFLPAPGAPCPNCGARSPRLGALKVAALSAVSSVTLMACYGAPMGEVCDHYPHLTEEATRLDVGRPVSSSDVTLSCGSGELFGFTVSQPEPGEVRVLWSGEQPITVSERGCGVSTEVSCAPASQSGELTFHTMGYSNLLVAAPPGAASGTALRIEFTPSCGDGVVQGYEQCDDGGREDGDGCSARCHFEGTDAVSDAPIAVP